MTILEDLKAIANGKIPKDSMCVKTTHNATTIELYGTNQNGLTIPLTQIEEFIGELEKICGDPEILYQLNDVEISGLKIQKVARYLREARDFGIHFASYTKMF